MKKLLTIVLVLGMLAAVVHGGRRFSRKGPQRHAANEERQVAQTIADLLMRELSPNDQATVVYLFTRQTLPYRARAEALRDELARRQVTVNEVWARDEGHYNDDDYSASLDIALNRHPESKALAVVSAGFVTHAHASPALRKFSSGGGVFLLVGSTHAQAPFLDMARRGQATILARRQTWLADATPHPWLADRPKFVRNNFTLLRGKPMQ